MLSDFFLVAKVSGGRSAITRYTVELVAIICTGSKSVFWADSAAETRTVHWKASPVHWKDPNVHWKASPSAAER